jgi:MYXO-CTERM domain-containing protein
MFRRTAVVLVAALAGLLVPNVAAAGGMAWFDFDRDYYVAGERAVGETTFWTARKDRHLLERTFYAYLIPGARSIDPPKIPSDAIPVGEVTLGGLARITFTVPDVAPGGYTVGICDRPCRHSYVGDLGGGWIDVVSTPEEARLLPVIDRLRARLERVRWDGIRKAQKSVRRDKALRTEMEELQQDLEQAEEELSARMLAAERRPEGSPDAFDRAGWAVAALALAALAGSFWRRRRRPAPAPLPHGPAAGSPEDGPSWQMEAAVLEKEREPAGVG